MWAYTQVTSGKLLMEIESKLVETRQPILRVMETTKLVPHEGNVK